MIVAHRFPLVLCGILVCLLSGCVSNEPMPPTNKFLVSVSNAQFYKYGPAQAFGPDLALPRGQKVTMLKREFGYSQVQLEDGTTGYMATEELKPAPPDPPPPKPTPARKKPKARGGSWFSSKPKRSNVESVPGDPLFDVNDVPLPMPENEPSIAPQPQPNLPTP